MEPDLEQARRRAKERLRAARRGEITLREDREPRLADAQRSVANELEESARLLIAHGADLEARDRDGLTPYSNAARRGDETLMAVLAETGADTHADPVAAWLGALVRGEPAERPRGVALRRADAELLPMFAGAGRDDVVERLLEAGNPLHSRGVDEGTALHHAGMWGRPGTVELLLARGAEPNLIAGPPEHPSAALGWTAWGSRVSEGMAELTADDVAVLFEEVEQRDERVYETGTVLVRVRCRGGRCEIDDRGWAVDTAGRSPGWLEAAERTVAELGWNVARTGTVFVAAAADRDIADLVRRTADAALAVRDALLALEE